MSAPPPGGTASDAQLRELLDAFLDDELDQRDRAAVAGLLDRSTDARAELTDIDRVRSMVRALPAVDAPFGFYERLTRRRRRRRTPGVAVAVVGAVAAAIVLVVAISPATDRFAPPVQDLSARHTMLASDRAEMPAGYDDLAAGEMDHMDAPESAAGYRRARAYEAPDGLHLVYEKGTAMISVFEQPGEVEWSGLPSGGSRMTMDGDDAWVMPMDAPSGTIDVVVLARDGLVVTVLGSAPHDDVVAIAEAMPDPPAPSMSERVGDACSWLAEAFGFPD